MEYYTTQIFLECHQDADHTIILNIRRSVSGIIHTLLDVSVYWKVQIQPAVAPESTYGEIRYMHKAVKKTKAIQKYMESSELHNGVPTLNWEDNKSWISYIQAKIVTPRFKHIEISICFLQ